MTEAEMSFTAIKNRWEMDSIDLPQLGKDFDYLLSMFDCTKASLMDENAILILENEKLKQKLNQIENAFKEV